MKRSEDVKEIAKAMSKMQSEMGSASKDCKAYQYKYADMASVWSVLKGPLTNNGLTVSQETFNLPDGPSVVTLVMHESGQWIETEPLTIPTGKKDAHSSGSALTYARRYQLCAILGIVTEDDDGAAAQKNAPAPQRAIPPRKCTQEEYDNFVKKWSGTFDKNNIESYLHKRSNHFNVHIRTTVYALMNDNEKFEKEFKIWENKNKQNVKEVTDEAENL